MKSNFFYNWLSKALLLVTKKRMAQLLKRQVSFLALMTFSEETRKKKIPVRVVYVRCVFTFINVMDYNVKNLFQILCNTLHKSITVLGTSTDYS